MESKYGVFNSEGCLEGGFTSRREAESVKNQWKRTGSVGGYSVKEICPKHDGEPLIDCSRCASE